MKKNISMTIVKWVAVVFILAAFGMKFGKFSLLNRAFRSGPDTMATRTEKSQPTSGVIDAVPGVWQGFTCLDGTKHIDYSILVDDVYWEVRFDRDDRRIHPMYPRNFKAGSHDEVTASANVVEFRIKDGQAAKSAPIAWSINNKRT